MLRTSLSQAGEYTHTCPTLPACSHSFVQTESKGRVLKDGSFSVIQIIDAFAIPPVGLVPTIETYNLAYPADSLTSFLGAVYNTPRITSALPPP